MDGLPRGVVTFLLTDVEGSTPLWERRPDDMIGAIARHHEILRDAVRECGGSLPEEQGEGDSVVAAFPVPDAAVTAAVAAQLRLIEQLPWLPVRMGLHTGEAHFRDARNYAGPTIIRAARLRSCAHGRQIITSGTTAQILRARYHGEASLRHLGEVPLKGLDRPEQAWQIVHPRLPDHFPPLNIVGYVRTNVPAASSTFVGRDSERQSLMDAVRRSRVVTVTGSGGCGKTRLAKEVAPELATDHPGGVWWVELASMTSESLLAEHVAMTCGIDLRTDADATAALVAHLAARGPTVLVLDNIEHLVGACADLCVRLLERCRDLRVLATGREPLMVAGETIWRVPSLAVPPDVGTIDAQTLLDYDATRLFVERARDSLATVRIDDGTAGLVASICRRLDGIPLAIELAAARTRTLPLDRLASGLDDAFRLLVGGARTSLERHRTLAASIAWSVDLLTDDERLALLRLSVFAGPFSLDAALAIMSHDAHAPTTELDLLARLVDKSLVLFVDDEGHYRLLETVRSFGLAALDATGGLDAARERHADWFATWCEEAGRAEHGMIFDPRRAEFGDALAALDWAMQRGSRHVYRILRALGWIWPQLGRFARASRWIRWLALDDVHTDRVAWAGAVAGLCQIGLGSRGDFHALVGRAREEVAADPGAALMFAWYDGTISMMFHGDVVPLEAAFESAVRDGEALAARRLGDMAALGREMRAEFPQVRAIGERLAPLLAAFGTGISAASASGVHTALINANSAEGHLDVARGMVLEGFRPEPVSAVQTATAAAKLGWWTDDPALVEFGVEVVGDDLAELMRAPAGIVHCIAALMDGRRDDALDTIRGVHRHYVISPGLRSHVSDLLHLCLIQAGRLDETRALATELAVDVERTGRAIAGIVTIARTDAWLARATGDTATWAGRARELIAFAQEHGLALVEIDAIELWAAALAAGGDRGRAAVLFASAADRRAAIGYRRRFAPFPEELDVLAAALTRDHPDAATVAVWPPALE